MTVRCWTRRPQLRVFCQFAVVALVAALCAGHPVVAANETSLAGGEAGGGGQADWSHVAARAMADSCAARQLTLRWPVAVRPLAEYAGGYTAGVGNIAWSGDHAETWRAGWCAVGVWCAPPAAGANAAASPGSRFDAPRGLYSHAHATLYVREPDGDAGGEAQTRATVAHEVVHALQYQNFPALHAPHLWFNRDLNAAVDAVVEGDAHLVGWAFDAQRRRHLCSVDPANVGRAHRDWWGWAPQAITALEGFPHVFGPGVVLSRLAAGGTRAVDALLRDPPLSSLAVLRGGGGPVDFIALPNNLARHVAEKKCQAGLANTVGVVGIWGLLAEHEDAAVGEQMPEFLAQWAGDRFVHLACEGARNDELAWLTRWRTSEAAAEFARRFGQVAAAAAQHGGVLGSPAVAATRSNATLVATPGLAAAADALFAAPVRTFDRYADWVAAGCFPDDCHSEEEVAAAVRQATEPFACGSGAPPPMAFANWLDRVRGARARAAEMQTSALSFALDDAGRLAVFCALNARRNADVLATCRAVGFGLRHLAALAGDPHWRLLPLCASGAEYRTQLRAAVANEADDAGAPARELELRAAELAAAALRADGAEGVRQLAASPPLSTLALLDGDHAGAVDFLHLPPAALAALGCEVLASDVVGAMGLWTRLLALGASTSATAPPAIVRAWRGDRQWYLQCGGEAGWVWASRWADAASAREFAARHLPALSVGAGAVREVQGRMVWAVPAGFAGVDARLKESVQSRFFAGFAQWREGGCYPQPGCAKSEPPATPRPAPPLVAPPALGY